MSQDIRIGPARILVAATVSTGLSGWTDIGVTRGDVRFRPLEGRVAFGRTDQAGGTPLAGAAWVTGPGATVIAPLLDHDVDKMIEWFPGAVKTTASGETALGWGHGFGLVTPMAFSLVPVLEYTEGEVWWEAEHAVWITRGVAVVVGESRMALPEGDDALEGSVMEVEIRCVGLDTSLAASGQAVWYGPRILYVIEE